MKKTLKKIVGSLNFPLIIFLILVGSLLLVANIKSEPVERVKQQVNKTVNDLSRKLNNAAQTDSNSVE